jgi:hypothetical protein
MTRKSKTNLILVAGLAFSLYFTFSSGNSVFTDTFSDVTKEISTEWVIPRSGRESFCTALTEAAALTDATPKDMYKSVNPRFMELETQDVTIGWIAFRTDLMNKSRSLHNVGRLPLDKPVKHGAYIMAVKAGIEAAK